MVHTAPQSAFKAHTATFPSTVIYAGGASDYIGKVYTRIRHIKHVNRGVNANLQWKLPPSLVKDSFVYIVSGINIHRTMAIKQNVCPRVLLMGMMINFKKEMELAFGVYTEAYDGTDSIHSIIPMW